MLVVPAGRNPSVAHFAPLFAFEHLPEGPMRNTSERIADLAQAMVDEMPDNPELSVGLRKLLEAKDCFVRCALLLQLELAGPAGGGS